MMDPPRHACRGRPMVCPGPCNPLKAHHHHHHHHRHHRQKPDVTKVATSGKDISLPDEFSEIMLLRSLKTDTSVTSMTSTDDISKISKTSSSTKIAVIRIPKIPRSKKVVPEYISQIIKSPDRVEMLGESSRPKTERTRELGKIESLIPARTIIYPKETAARTATYQAPKYLNDMRCAIMMRLNGLMLKTVSPFFLCLTILVIYAGIHVLLAWRTSAYQFFVCSQICGVFALVMWRLTGTILI